MNIGNLVPFLSCFVDSTKIKGSSRAFLSRIFLENHQTNETTSFQLRIATCNEKAVVIKQTRFKHELKYESDSSKDSSKISRESSCYYHLELHTLDSINVVRFLCLKM